MLEGRKCTCGSIDLVAMALSKKSEYFSSLSAEARKRYEGKLTVVGLAIDPYVIDVK